MPISLHNNKSDYIILVGPGNRVYNDRELHNFESGLKKQGVNVIRIGDAENPLTEADYNRFYAEIKAAKNPKIVFWGHGGVFRDYHGIAMEENVSFTTDLLLKAGKALEGKAADILLVTCKGGGAIPNIKNNLPQNVNVYSLVTGNQNLSNYDLLAMIKALNTLDISKGNLTVDQLLITFLMSNEVYQSMPQIYPDNNYTSLKEKYSSIIGRQFTELEKETIIKELSKYSTKENILAFISQIEDPNNINLLNQYGQLLALSLVCAKTETYQFNTNAIGSMIQLFFDTLGKDLTRAQNPVVRNATKVLQTMQYAHENLLATLLQLNSADKKNETSYLYNILMNKFAPLLRKPETTQDWVTFSLTTALLMQAGLNIENLWLGEDNPEAKDGFKSYLSSAVSTIFLTANLGWLLNDYSRNQLTITHPALAPVINAANRFLTSLLEKNWATEGKLPESSFYYLLRDEAVTTGALLVTLLSNLNFLHEKTTPQLLNLSMNALQFLEKMIEMGYKYYNGKYSDEVNQALLFNLQVLQNLGKNDEIVQKLNRFAWTSDPVNDADTEAVKQIKEFAVQYRSTNAQSSVNATNTQATSTANLMKSLQTEPATKAIDSVTKDSKSATVRENANDTEIARNDNDNGNRSNSNSISSYLKSGLCHFGNVAKKVAENVVENMDVLASDEFNEEILENRLVL